MKISCGTCRWRQRDPKEYWDDKKFSCQLRACQSFGMLVRAEDGQQCTFWEEKK